MSKLYIVFGLKNLGGGLRHHTHYICENEEMVNTINSAPSYVEVTNIYEIEATFLDNFFDKKESIDMDKIFKMV
jgi:hypothetical protein